jgi:hypothetical protein
MLTFAWSEIECTTNFHENFHHTKMYTEYMARV